MRIFPSETQSSVLDSASLMLEMASMFEKKIIYSYSRINFFEGVLVLHKTFLKAALVPGT